MSFLVNFANFSHILWIKNHVLKKVSKTSYVFFVVQQFGSTSPSEWWVKKLYSQQFLMSGYGLASIRLFWNRRSVNSGQSQSTENLCHRDANKWLYKCYVSKHGRLAILPLEPLPRTWTSKTSFRLAKVPNGYCTNIIGNKTCNYIPARSKYRNKI
jgi:hypothetical protein